MALKPYSSPVMKGDPHLEGTLERVEYKNNADICEVTEHGCSRSSSQVISNETCEDNCSTQRHPTTYTETLAHFLKSNIGSGVLASGDAFKNSGLVVGPILIVVLATLCVFTQHQLVNASNYLTKVSGSSRRLDFRRTVKHSFRLGPPFLRRLSDFVSSFVNVFMCMTQLGFCCVYFVFVSSNIKQVIDQYTVNLDVRIYIAVVLFPLLLLSSVKRLKFLVPISHVANGLMCIGVIVTIYLCTKDGLPPVSERNLSSDLSRLPLFLGTVVYSFEAICMTLPLRNEMKHPHQFTMYAGVLNVGTALLIVIMVAMGSVSYMKYGDGVQGSVTLNLNEKNILCQVLRVALSIALLLTYPIQLYVPVDLVWPLIRKRLEPLKRPAFAELTFRWSVVFFTFILAVSVPQLGLFISLVGSLPSATLAFILPPLMDWSWRYNMGISYTRHIINIFTLLFGFLICGWGTYTSVRNIVIAFIAPKE